MNPIRLDDPTLQVLETRRSLLYLSEHDVWKRRKPEAWGMRSATTPAERRRACVREWQLNGELAPDVYRGPVAITRGPEGLCLGGPGPAVDWALHMRRLPESHRLDRRIEAGRIRGKAIRRVARSLARFHARASAEPAAVAPADAAAALRRLIGLRFAPDGDPVPRELQKAADDQRAFVDAHAALFAERAERGAVSACHGELVLDHVFVDEALGVDLIGRLDLGGGLGRVDVCADVASLAAELAAAGRADLAERFLAEYARQANDFALYRLVDFYASLGASTRAKFELACASQFSGDSRAKDRAVERARRYALLARAAQLAPLLPPVVVAMGGQVASGKSTAAKWLSRQIGAPVVSTDRTRDFLLGARLGAAPHEWHWERAYQPGFSERVYGEVMERASAVLASGRPVVLDGCFRSAGQRGAARALARRFDLPFLFVEARVPEAVQHERLLARSRRDGEPASTWLEIADAMRREWQPADELARDEHMVLDTTLPKRVLQARVKARLPTWPKALTG